MSAISSLSQVPYPPIDKGVPQTLAKWRAENYTDVRYKLNLTIEKKAPTLKGNNRNISDCKTNTAGFSVKHQPLSYNPTTRSDSFRLAQNQGS